MSLTIARRLTRPLLLAATIAAAATLGGCVVEPGYGYYGQPAYVYAPPVYVQTGWGWGWGHGWGGYHRGWR